MTEHLNWTKEEFKAFLLLFAAQTNFIETQEEIEYIESTIFYLLTTVN